MRRPLAPLAAVILVISGCGGDGAATTEPTTPSPSAADTTTTSAPTVEPATPATATPTSTVAPGAFAVDGPEPATVEIRFGSGDFELVGDLILPGGEGPFPAVVVVSGSGPQTRTSTPTFPLVAQIFGDAGFAVFSWDKPGSGKSTGTFEEGQGLRQRAAILADGVERLIEHPTIDPERIGLWGLSQAGWVMPLALELTDDVAFMISVSGGGEDSIEQMAYQISERLVCEGVPREQAELAEQWGPQAAKGTTYELYVEAMEILLQIPGMGRFIGTEMASEEDWQPWPPAIDAYFDPMTVIEHTTIPVLAVFGELDKNVDPAQGAEAYERALAAAGNPDYHVEVIPGIGHTMQAQETGCIGELGGAVSERYRELLEEWGAKLAAQP